MDHVGMDLGKRESQVAILTEDGEVIDMRIRTERHRLVEIFARRPKAKILVEASTESEWVACCLEDLGHEVIVADPNYAPMYAQRTRRVKTDRRDAHALARACHLGAYRPAHRTTLPRRHLRTVLAVREAIVRTRAPWISRIQPLLRREGFRVRTGAPETFSKRVEEVALPPALNPDPKFVSAERRRGNASEGLVHASNGPTSPRHPSIRGGPSDALEGTKPAADGQG